jgi:hypothetical protein
VGSRPDQENELFSIYLILLAALGPGSYSAANRNMYQNRKIKFMGSRERPVRRADNLTSICVPILWTM